MTPRQTSSYSRAYRTAAFSACMFFLGAYVSIAFGAPTDISNVPLASNNPAQAKPNIMLLMDTSASMGWTHMPDSVEGPSDNLFTSPGVKQVGYKSYQCNVLYYNPNTTYDLPKNADGTFWTAPSFNAASYDAYDSAAPTYNLATQFKAYDDTTLRAGKNGPGTTEFNDTAQAAYYYVYSGTQTLVPGQAPCSDADSLSSAGTIAATGAGGGTWTRVLVSSSSGPSGTNEQQNFANWYSFYRTRMSLTKSAASLAFNPLTDSFRVGFISVQPKAKAATSVEAAKYLPLADFGATQRTDWYAKLFSQKPSGTSPAREGLARVGRHYAGMTDSINQGMPEDPVQYSCQQNFTILTTDGYWNDQDESAGGGPLKIDGTTLVGQQDGTLTGASGWTPRPIWEGFADGTLISTDKTNGFSFVACPSGWFNKTTVQYLKSTVQNLQSTTQLTQSTSQPLRSTKQELQSTVQNLQSTQQVLQTTNQPRQSTVQNLQSTLQNLRSTTQVKQSTTQRQMRTLQDLRSTTQNVMNTSQNIATTTQNLATVTITRRSTTQMLQSTTQTRQSTTQTLQSTNQPRRSTVQNLQSTSQNVKNTNQTLQSTNQPRQSTVQNRQSTLQNVKNTTQTLQSTNQPRQSTAQNLMSTTQNLQTTVQNLKSTSQIRWYNPSTESVEPVQSCPVGGSCTTITTTNVPVQSCSAATASSANNWTTTTCSTSGTSNAPISTCSPITATVGNNWTAVTCSANTTVNVAVQNCSAATAAVGNNWTTTTCSTNNTTNVAVQTCSASSATSGNAWTTTTCNPLTSGPTAVQTCAASAGTSGNGWVTTTCTPINQTNIPVQTCSASAATSGNSWTATTCPAAVVTTNVAVQSCSAATAAVGNNWTTTTCSTNNTTNVAVQTCSASSATSGNAWTTTTCNPLTSGPTAVQTCAASAGTSGNGWVTTTCTPINQTNIPVQTCSASAATSGNSWTTTTCPAAVVTTNVAVQTCSVATAAAGNNWTTTTCSTNNTTNVAVQTCSASSATSGNAWTTTTCNPLTSTPTAVQTCTASAGTSGNAWVTTTCTPNNTVNVPVQTCSASSANSGNLWVTTTCSPNNTANVAVQTCTAAAAASGNNWTATVCTPNNTTNVAVASCNASAATSGNNWTTTTCNILPVSGPTPVQTCAAVAPTSANGYQQTTCSQSVNATPVQICTAVAASSGNNWVATTCSVNNQTNVGVQTCTASVATSGNGWTTTTCPSPIVTTSVPVQTCAAAAATAGNAWTATVCTVADSGWLPVSTCSTISETSANQWVATTCRNNNTSNVAVATCTPQTKALTNSWVTITCTPNNTTNTPVQTCVPSAGTAGNSWVTTTCPAPLVTSNVAVQTCSASAASSSNSWTATTCSTNNTTNVAVQTCTASTASSGNNWTETSCNPLTSGPTGVQTCTNTAGTSGNGWVTTTCTPNNTANISVSTCAASAASAGNNWTATTCPAPIVTTSVPVQSCSAAVAALGNGWTTTTCPTPIVTTDVPVQLCTVEAATSGNNWTSSTCPAPIVTTDVPVQLCAASLGSSANGWVTTTCGNNNAANLPALACVPSSPDALNGWTTTTCPPPVVTTNVPAASCLDSGASAGNGWTATTCQTITTPLEFVNSCATGSSGAPNYINATCSEVSGEKAQYQTTTTVTKTLTSGGTVISGLTPSVTTTTDSPAELNGICYLAGTPVGAPPALPSPNPQHAGLDIAPWPTVGPMPSGGCAAWPCSVSQANTGGSINSLADVAQYYYVTDLRPSAVWVANIAEDNVFPVGGGPEDDRAKHQHMTTFTVALGVSGTLTYDEKYKTATTGDFADIRTGVKNWPLWPDPSKATWDNSANTYTAKSSWEDPRSIDDFWHTAVNGRGQYFSAGDPKAVVSGLNGALSGIESSLGAGSAAGTSSQEPVAGDNFAYVASYLTSKWTGDVEAREIANDGSVGLTALWSARSKLQSLVGAACDNRNIYLIRAGATNNLVNFTWNTQACDSSGLPTGSANTGLNAGEQAYFNTNTNVGVLSQYSAMTDGSSGSVDQRTAAKGANLVNYLRGQRGNENFESGKLNKLYRGRDAVLGDIVNSQPVYVKAPFAEYFDAGYEDFKVAQKDRTSTVYVGANDGMLHAFNANAYGVDGSGNQILDINGGKELWAVIPSSVIGSLYKLSDNNYKNTHTYFVDATPVVGDVDVAAPIIPAVASDRATWTPDWRSILVGGLNSGGKAYFALDVTDPASPKALWEFKIGTCGSAGEDCHLGYTFGRPVITKLLDGRWVVILTSGYNNVRSPAGTGDGLGYVYVLKASTGELLYKIATTAGDASTPSGLAQINNYVSNARFDNSTKRVYGTDISGNVWMFDVNDSALPSGREAHLLGTTMTTAGDVQPIMVRPELAELGGKAWVFVGTGRLLGASDLDTALATTTRTQSVYGFVDLVTHPDSDDPLDPSDPLTPPAANLHSVLRPLAITYDASSNRVSTPATCDVVASPKRCRGDYGWVLDLPDSGERVNVGMRVLGNTLVFASNVLESSACSIAGYGFINYVDSSNGASVNPTASTVISEKIAGGLIVGINTVWSKPRATGTGAQPITGLGSPKLIVTTSAGTRVTKDAKLAPVKAQGRRVSWRPLISP